MKSLLDLHTELANTNLSYKKFRMLQLLQVTIGNYYLGVYEKFHLLSLIKKMGLEGVAKWFSFKVKHPFLRKRPHTHFDYLFINEVNNKPTLESFHNVFALFDGTNSAVLVSDLRLAEKGATALNIFEFSSLGLIFRSIVDTIRFTRQVRIHKDEVEFLVRKYGVPKSFLLANSFDSIFMINVVETMFKHISASKIILMSDVHKLSRIITLKAAETGIPTFVLQHGATAGEAGYLPVLADKILVWGEASREWLLERHQPAGKVAVVGSPRMDKVHYLDPGAKDIKNEIRKILVVMSEVQQEEPFLETVKNGLVQLGNKSVEVSVKLHPGLAVDYSFMIHKVFANTGINYKVLRFEPLNELLNETDVVVVTTSTVGMEAIIQNKPIVQYKASNIFSHRMSYEDFDCSFVFESGEAFSELFKNPSVLFSKLGNYRAFVTHYFGELDGRSSARARECIVSYKKVS